MQVQHRPASVQKLIPAFQFTKYHWNVYIYIYINLNTFNNYSVHAYQFKERKPHIQFVKIRRYLQTYDVTFRSAVKSVSRLFFSLNDLTDDKAESNDICFWNCNRYFIRWPLRHITGLGSFQSVFYLSYSSYKDRIKTMRIIEIN